MPRPCSTWHIVYDRMDLAQAPIQLHYTPTKSMIMQAGLQLVSRVNILVLNVEHTYILWIGTARYVSRWSR